MKKIKNPTPEELERLKKAEEAEALRLQLMQGPESLIQRKQTDRSLDHRIEKVELLGGKIINLRELQDYLDGMIHDYGVMFKQNFYKQIFRLNGWKMPECAKIKEKPSIVAVYTNDFIYGRFPKEILPKLQGNNQFNEIGVRMYRHFQFLSEEGAKKLETFIEDAVAIMERCTTWDEFVKEHAKAYGFPFQTSLFE